MKNKYITALWNGDTNIVAAAADAAEHTPPRFTMTAYNGGPMQLEGFQHMVVVDGSTVRGAAANVPIYVHHLNKRASVEGQMRQLFGQTDKLTVDEATGQIKAEGPVTGESELALETMKHIRNGFKFQASISGKPGKLDFVRAGSQAVVNGKTVIGPVFIARAVTLDHIAFVPLGADTSTSANIAASAAEGFNMDFSKWLLATYLLTEDTLTPEQQAKFEAEYNKVTAEKTVAAAAPVTDIEASIQARRASEAAEDQRIAAVRAAAKDFPQISATAVRDGWTAERAELEVLRAQRSASTTSSTPNGIAARAVIPEDGLQNRSTPAERGGRHTARAGGLSNSLCTVIETAGLISAGYSADRLANNPVYGVRAVEIADRVMQNFGRGLGPAGLMRLAASFAGIQLPHSNSDSNFLNTIQAEFSTMSLPVILSNVMNKFLLDGYNAVDPDYAANDNSIAWKKFTRINTLQDFKPHYRVRIVSDLRLKSLGPTGEIQHGQVGEQSYSVQAGTKAIMLGLSRENIINDDVSAMNSIPTEVGNAAGVTVATSVYAAIIANKQSDGSTAFFTGSDVTTKGAVMAKNLLTGAALALDTLTAAEAQFAIQTTPYGLPAGLVPKILLLPPGIKTTGMQLFQSTQLIPSLASGGNAKGVPSNNLMAGKYRPVCSAYLSQLAGGSASTWYLATDAASPAYLVEAGFLNGQQMPVVESAEADFNRLGIAFRGFLDFGVSLAEPRAAVKNTA